MDMKDQSAPSAEAAVVAVDKPKARSVHERVVDGLKNAADHHSTVAEHLERRGHKPSAAVDLSTGQIVAVHPWQREALLARFRASGIHADARIDDATFEAALHETLHGRI